MYTAAAGALVAQANADTIADNLANVSTSGFKRSLLQVQSAQAMDISRMQTDPGSGPGNLLQGHAVSVPVGRLGLGAQVYDTPTSFEQGALMKTGGANDVAVNGSGFFTIQTPQGLRYTRDGSFVRDPRGLLMTQTGGLVLGQGGAVALPPQGQGDMSVGRDGTVSINGVTVDRLRLTQFGNLTALRKEGDNQFVDYGAQPANDTTSTVTQGSLEQSNGDVVRSMVDLISAQRWFEANQKVIQTEAQATTAAIQTVGNSKA